jgi:hypothetical protein
MFAPDANETLICGGTCQEPSARRPCFGAFLPRTLARVSLPAVFFVVVHARATADLVRGGSARLVSPQSDETRIGLPHETPLAVPVPQTRYEVVPRAACARAPNGRRAERAAWWAPRSLSEYWWISLASEGRIRFCLGHEQDIPPLEDRRAAVSAADGARLRWPDHLARFVLNLVKEAIDLSKITGTYGSERGQPPFDPTMMTALLLIRIAAASTRRAGSPRRAGNGWIL